MKNPKSKDQSPKVCPKCDGTNTGETAPEFLDYMRDYMCYDCNEDFYEIGSKYSSK